jgi:hypothetical protein
MLDELWPSLEAGGDAVKAASLATLAQLGYTSTAA